MSDISAPTTQSVFETNKCQCAHCHCSQPEQQYMVSNYAFAAALCSHFRVEETDDIYFAKRLEQASVVYKVGQHVIIDYQELPIFGKIEAFICLPSSNEWCIVVCVLHTVKFKSHFHSYVVVDLPYRQFKICRLDSWLIFIKCVSTKNWRVEKHCLSFVYHIMSCLQSTVNNCAVLTVLQLPVVFVIWRITL